MGTQRKTSREMTLAELARRSGVPARTIRLYITRGLVPRPLRAGKHAAYGSAHVEALDRIRALQAEGHSLAEIGRRAAMGKEARSLPRPAGCFLYQLSPEVRVEVSAGISPWRQRHIQRALITFASLLGGREERSPGDGSSSE